MKRFILTTMVILALPSLALGIVDPIGFDPEATLSSSGTEVTVSGVVVVKLKHDSLVSRCAYPLPA